MLTPEERSSRKRAINMLKGIIIDSRRNEAEKLYELLLNKFPSHKITIDEPLVKDGVWALDIRHIAVAWKESKGFGLVWDDDHGYGEGAQEVYKDLDKAYSRIVELME